jgi:hypothetical protein
MTAVDPAQVPVMPQEDRQTAHRPWLRVGLISAVLWMVIGLAIVLVIDHLPGEPVIGWLPALSGPVILWIIGRRHGLHGSWSWTQAGLFQLGFVILVLSVAIYAAVIGGFLGPGDSSSIESVGFATTNGTSARTKARMASASSTSFPSLSDLGTWAERSSLAALTRSRRGTQRSQIDR